MRRTVSDVPARVRASLAAGEPCWHPGLASCLVDSFWAREPNRDRTGYCTASWLAEPLNGMRIPVPGYPTMWVEPLPQSLARRFNAPASAGSVPLMARAVAAALVRLGGTGPADSVATLVRSIHCVEASQPGYDLSHSEPTIPFSVLLSNPAGERNAGLRLAEALLHEAMHLQLTLIEQDAPIVAGTTGSGYSPWQGRKRPIQGLLHGLYVFTAIRRWLIGLSGNSCRSDEDAIYVHRRIGEIDGEVDAVKSLGSAADLTGFGRALADALLREFDGGPRLPGQRLEAIG